MFKAEENDKNNNLDTRKNDNNDSNHTIKDVDTINYKLNKLTKAVEAVAKAQIDQMADISENFKKPVLTTSIQVLATPTTTTPNITPSLQTLSIAHNSYF